MEQAPEVVIRRSRSSEWRALRELRLRSLESDPLAFGSTHAEETAYDETRWRNRATDGAESETTSQWVAEEGSGRLIGSVVVAEVEGKVYVFAMWVDPRYRAQGIGARLLDTSLAWASSAFSGRSIFLDVNPRQAAAVRLYESRGFRRSAADRPLGHSPGENRFEMKRPAAKPLRE